MHSSLLKYISLLRPKKSTSLCNSSRMASASSSSRFENEKYDLFISFRGEDTRLNFTSHLHGALKKEFLVAFRDDKNLEKGEEIAVSLIQAINNSSVSLIVFSQNYASSKWCLDELVHIMKCKNEKDQFVIPIFYNVDPSDVRNQTASYKEAFEELEKRHDHEKVTSWRDVLSKAANLSGRHCIQNVTDENTLIDEIVSDVNAKQKYMYKCKSASKGLFGMDEMIEPIEVLLQKSHKVGIWGMGGLGKTTMTKELFGRLSSKYNSRCFFENVRETIQRNGLEHVRNYLVSELLGEDYSSNALRDGEYVARKLQRKKAFVVLDDVNDLMDLQENILNHLADGSKVIITTREQQLLKANEYELYEAKLLSYESGRQLFISKAFGQGDSKDGYEQLIEKFVDYTKHLPLALKVIGSCLRSKDKKIWEDNLKKLRDGSPNEVVLKALRVSYDGLDNEEKKIFLDIACFLKGKSEEFVKELLESYGLHSTSGMETLKDKALITVTTSGKVEMHDLMEEMGHQIVREENIDEPGRRTKLWDPNEICNVFKKCEGENVEGIIMNCHSIEHLELETNTFNNMKKLRFLKIQSPYFWRRHFKQFSIPTTGLQSISSEIRYFHWKKYPGKSLPSNFCAELLVEFNLTHSEVETLWEGVQVLTKLRRLDLTSCKRLRDLPDFSKAYRLESIDLFGCESLREVPQSLLQLHSLVSLNVKFCSSLESLQSGIHLKSLKQVDACVCSKLKEFSLSSEELTSLDLTHTNIEELKPSMGLCLKLKTLKIPYSLKWKNLPKEALKCLPSLENLKISGIFSKTIDSERLGVLFDDLHSLQSLHLTLSGLKELPDKITQLSGLKELHLDDCNILTKLPDNMRHLSHLQLLSLRECIDLQTLPELPPSLRTLDAYNCISLERASIPSIPENCGDKLFSFKGCYKLDVGSIEEQAMGVLQNAVQEKQEVTIIYTAKKVPKWFGDYRTQHQHEHGSHTFQLSLSSPHNLLGFLFCFRCKHYTDELDVFVIDEGGEDVFHVPPINFVFADACVCLMCRAGLSKSILEKIEGTRRSHGATPYNPILSFKCQTDFGAPIIGFGVYPIYSSSKKCKAIEL